MLQSACEDAPDTSGRNLACQPGRLRSLRAWASIQTHQALSKQAACFLVRSNRFSLRLYYFKLEMNLFAARDGIQVMLPDLAKEAKTGKLAIQVYKELKPQELPNLQYRHAGCALA